MHRPDQKLSVICLCVCNKLALTNTEFYFETINQLQHSVRTAILSVAY